MSEARKKCWQNEEYRRRISESLKKYHWYNNGVKSVRALECPEGFKPGRLRTW